jgi:DNA-binding MarR family transcriptional regulator
MTDGIGPLRVDADFEQEFPGTRRSATECVINLVRASGMVLAEMDHRRRAVAGLSAAAAQVLAIIEGAGEPLPPHVIAERLLVTVTSGTMTSLLDTLERRGLVCRVTHPNDRRKIRVEITDLARSLLDQLLPQVHAAEREFMAVLRADERKVLIGLLGRLQDHMREISARPLTPVAATRRRPPRHRALDDAG